MTHPNGETIEQARLQRLFSKAELFELPTQITLNPLGFYHWYVERTNRIYIVAQYADALTGQSFKLYKHVGAPSRGRQCDLCRRVKAVSQVVSIRSTRPLPEQAGGYRARYSYICSDLDECRDHVHSRILLERLLSIHSV